MRIRLSTLISLACLAILPAAMCPAQIAGYPDFEIVESVPKETVLDNPGIRNTHDVWMEMIHGAKKTIDLEEFYISSSRGESLDDIISALGAAAGRGVTVRIIIDARMHKTYPDPADSLGRISNISVRVIDFGKLDGGIQHAKYFIVDGQEAFIGSQNFDWRALDQIHEIGVRIRYPGAVAMYQEIFDIDWSLSEQNDPSRIAATVKRQSHSLPFRIPEGSGDTVVFAPTMSPKGMIPDTAQWDETAIVGLLDNARQDIMVQVLTYSPAERGGERYAVLDDALRRAASRGVKVRLIVSDWSIGRQIISSLQSLSQVPNIQVRYTSIPDLSGRYISFARVEHCKYLVVDSTKAWVGTSNWEKSYFYTVRNVGVVVENRKISSILREVFLKSWDGPYAHPVTSEGTYQPRKHGEQ